MQRWLVPLAGVSLLFGLTLADGLRGNLTISARETKQSSEDREQGDIASKDIRVTLRGKVVWLGDAMRERLEVKFDDDTPNPAALETDDGRLVPLLKDTRGRAFYQDERLRGRPVELVVRRWPGVPYVQVVNVYSIKNGKRYAVDYWCDTCAISTYDKKVCPCCQDIFGPMRLREEPVD
jgi:hypothetical protein